MKEKKHLFLAILAIVFFAVKAQQVSAATVIFQDSFTGSSGTLLQSHTPDVGTSWSEIIDNGRDIRIGPHPTNNIEVTSNGSNVGTLYQANATYNTADYDVSADVLWSGGDSNYTRTLAARIQDANNMYTLVYGANIFQLWKRTSGTWSLLASGSSYPSGDTSSAPYIGDNVRLRVQGNVISGFINNTEVVSTTDSDHTNAGVAGVGFGYVNDSSDDSGTGVDTDNFLVQTIDNTPQVSSFFPVDDASDVTSSANLVIQFDRVVSVATGTIDIYDASDDSLFESIVVTSSRVTGSGSQTIIINPSSSFSSEASYYVQITSTAFVDTSSTAYVGISDTTTWNFTIADEVDPVIQSLSPTDDATGISTSSNFIITFDETIVTSTGNILLYRSSDDQLIETFAMASSTVTASGTTALVINPSTNLQDSTSYYITVDATAVDDDSGNSFAGISNQTTWNFTTIDSTNPSVQSLSPADGASDVSITSNFVVTFDEIVVVSSGNVTIYRSSDDTVVETISISSGNVTGSGTSQVTINPTSNLSYGTSYYVQIDPSAIDDTTGNSYGGITDTATWNISTAAPPATDSDGGGITSVFLVSPPVAVEFSQEAEIGGENGIEPKIDNNVLYSNADPEVVSLMAYAIDNPDFTGVSMQPYQKEIVLDDVKPGQNVYVRYVSYTGHSSKDFTLAVPDNRISQRVVSDQEQTKESVSITQTVEKKESQVPQFTRNLSLGMSGKDVQKLQQLLNDLGFTVNESGPGSKGNETEYFGPLTYNAVQRFQIAYKEEILFPLELDESTGYVGERTLRVLRKIR